MIDELERNIAFYEVRLPAIPSEKGFVGFPEVLQTLLETYDDNEAYWIHEKETASVRLIDCDAETYPDFLVLLLSLSNSRIADPSFENINDGDFRDEPKRPGEGVSSSAHIVIKSTPENRPGFPHKMALERITGLGSSTITPFLNHVLKKGYERTVPRPIFRFNNSDRHYRASVDIAGDLSTRLREQLRRGRVTGIELIDHVAAPAQIDEDQVFFEKKRTLEMSVEGNPDENVLTRSLNALKRRLRGEGYDELKVKIVYEDVGAQTIPIRMDIDQDATETLAVRKELVAVEDPMGQRHARINHELVRGIIRLIDA